MKKSTFLAIIIAVLAIAWMASGMMKDNAPKTDTKDPQKTAKVKTLQSVQTEALYSESHQQKIRLSGRTEASKSTTISAEIQGKIKDFKAREGSVLKEGDLIASINTDDRYAALKSAQNRVKQREIQYKTAKNLIDKGYSTEVQVATQRAELESARAELRRAELELKNTKITAPFDGILEKRDVEKGDYVRVGDNIADFIGLDPIKVAAFVAEQRIQSIELGQMARAKLPNGNTHEGIVSFISRTADPTTRTFRVEIEIENTDLKIADGLTTEVTLFGGKDKLHKISPAILTLSEAGDVGVKYVDDQNIAQFMPVAITSSASDAVYVDGLPDPVNIITVGQDFVTVGQTVDTQVSQTQQDETQ